MIKKKNENKILLEKKLMLSDQLFAFHIIHRARTFQSYDRSVTTGRAGAHPGRRDIFR
jgi:hypothetical protein